MKSRDERNFHPSVIKVECLPKQHMESLNYIVNCKYQGDAVETWSRFLSEMTFVKIFTLLKLK